MVTSYFDPGNELIYAIGRSRGLNRWREGVRQVLVGRSRHVENRRVVVWGVYLLDRRRDNPALVLLIIPRVMAEFPINKGIGRSVEFKGLKAQYLFIFCGGLLVVFVLFVILYMSASTNGSVSASG